jgi:HTH-type transcriptional regulator, competence development regulator
MATDIYRQFGDRVKELRKGKKWSQTYLAIHTGLSRTFISDLENGLKEPCLLTMVVLAKGFEVRMSDLLKGLDL